MRAGTGRPAADRSGATSATAARVLMPEADTAGPVTGRIASAGTGTGTGTGAAATTAPRPGTAVPAPRAAGPAEGSGPDGSVGSGTRNGLDNSAGPRTQNVHDSSVGSGTATGHDSADAPPESVSGTGAPHLRRHLGTLVGVLILGLLVWRLGTGAFLDGLRRIDVPTLAAAVGIGGVTTACSAWRWSLVARGLGIRLPFRTALAGYYRALFLNAALPGGVLGDVHRAVRHGRSAGDMGRGVRAVVLERTAGQVVLTVAGLLVLLVAPSPVRDDVRHAVPLAALAAVGALAVVLAVRMNRAPGAPARHTRALRAVLAEAREGLLSRRNGPGVLLSSVVVLAGHLATFALAARAAAPGASVVALLPLAVLALFAMGLPLNVGGFGPREGVTAWAFGAAGLGADTGLAVAVVYGVLCFAAALPGVLALPARGYSSAAPVSSAKYAPKESARLASSSPPLSAEPREGRPMTPEAV